MNTPYLFFCELPGMEITQECQSFEEAFRAQHAYMDMVMDQMNDFGLIDRSMGVQERGIRIMAPQAMERARRSGLMDQILTEESGTIESLAEFVDSVLPQEKTDELVLA